MFINHDNSTEMNRDRKTPLDIWQSTPGYRISCLLEKYGAISSKRPKTLFVHGNGNVAMVGDGIYFPPFKDIER